MRYEAHLFMWCAHVRVQTFVNSDGPCQHQRELLPRVHVTRVPDLRLPARDRNDGRLAHVNVLDSGMISPEKGRTRVAVVIGCAPAKSYKHGARFTIFTDDVVHDADGPITHAQRDAQVVSEHDTRANAEQQLAWQPDVAIVSGSRDIATVLCRDAHRQRIKIADEVLQLFVIQSVTIAAASDQLVWTSEVVWSRATIHMTFDVMIIARRQRTITHSHLHVDKLLHLILLVHRPRSTGCICALNSVEEEDVIELAVGIDSTQLPGRRIMQMFSESLPRRVLDARPIVRTAVLDGR